MNLNCVVHFAVTLVFGVDSNEFPVRKTANGPIEGVILTSSLNQKYFAFEGVPYAEPPITGKADTGVFVDRRFKAPIPLERVRDGILKTHNFANACIPSIYIGNHSKTAKISEDCLFLNIYEPVGGSVNKTVLVWIHGGGFTSGDATNKTFGPDFLLSQDNIVVTIQYRVGIFGFLNLGTPEYSGNMGLKDQQLALKWVHENIRHFSGNKNEILLFGQSAGSASVAFQLLNRKSCMYFNRAYMSSSTALTFHTLVKQNHLQKMKKFLKINDEMKLIKRLKTADSDFLSAKYPFNSGKTQLYPFVPTVEDPESIDAFMTKSPEEIYKTEGAPNKDVMFSFNSEEILAFRANFVNKTDPILKEDIEDGNIDLPFEGFNKSAFPVEYNKCLELLKADYYPDLNNTEAVKLGNIDLLSDLVYIYSIIKGVILQSTSTDGDINKIGRRNTFLMRFSKNTDINLLRNQRKISYRGAAHADDLCYYFHCHSLGKLYEEHSKRRDEVHYAIMKMVMMITNFAKKGDPSLEGDVPFKSCKSPDEIYCQEVSNNPKSSVTKNIQKHRRYETWRKIEDIYKNATSS